LAAVKTSSATRCLVLPAQAVAHLTLVLFGFKNTAARRAVATEQTVDDGSGAADTCLHPDGLRWAVLSAGSTLHAGVTMIDLSLTVIQSEYPVGANQGAHAAADASLHIKLQSDHVLKIDKASQ
jgi:hypothetical protein